MRRTIDSIDHHAARLGLLAGAVLQLARTITPPINERQAKPLRGAVGELAKATSAADTNSDAACAHTAAAREHAAALEAAAQDRADAVLADLVRTCAEDLQAVIDC
jgi:hypothetical protein